MARFIDKVEARRWPAGHAAPPSAPPPIPITPPAGLPAQPLVTDTRPHAALPPRARHVVGGIVVNRTIGTRDQVAIHLGAQAMQWLGVGVGDKISVEMCPMGHPTGEQVRLLLRPARTGERGYTISALSKRSGRIRIATSRITVPVPTGRRGWRACAGTHRPSATKIITAWPI